MLEFEQRRSPAERQAEDLMRLGHVILALGIRSLVSPKIVELALSRMQQQYSTELIIIITSLLSGQGSASLHLREASEHLADELDLTLAAADALHSHLRSEYDNGRVLRLLLQLGLINERPEYAHAPQWSETGDRYVLKLFRDYLFHQTRADGGMAWGI